MAEWTTQDPSTLLPGEPWTSAKALAAFENVEAAMEGAVGAPPLQFAALGRLVAGNSVRVQGSTTTATGAGNFVASVSHGFLQVGTVRCVILVISGTVSTRRVVRTRNGVETVLASASGTDPLSVDVGVIHGDAISLQGDGNASTGTGVHRASISIESGNLWSGVGSQVIGNNNV